MTSLLLTILLVINTASAEIIPCAAGYPCTCLGGVATNITCILDCTESGSCNGWLQCREGDNCYILCTSDNSCQSINIEAEGAKDVAIDCSGDNACNDGTVYCGEGPCIMSCGQSACDTKVYLLSESYTFNCAPSTNCQTILNDLSLPIQTGTTQSPTISPTSLPSRSPTSDPTASPTAQIVDCSNNWSCHCPSTNASSADIPCQLKLSILKVIEVVCI